MSGLLRLGKVAAASLVAYLRAEGLQLCRSLPATPPGPEVDRRVTWACKKGLKFRWSTTLSFCSLQRGWTAAAIGPCYGALDVSTGWSPPPPPTPCNAKRDCSGCWSPTALQEGTTDYAGPLHRGQMTAAFAGRCPPPPVCRIALGKQTTATAGHLRLSRKSHSAKIEVCMST